MATRRVLAELASYAQAAGLPALEIESVGGVDAAARVASGEPFDLVFLAADALARLAGAGHVVPASVTPLLLSQTAVAVPSGAGDPADAHRAVGAGAGDFGAGYRGAADSGVMDSGAAASGAADSGVAAPIDAAGGIAPAFPDAAAMRDALRATSRIGYSTGPSGTALLRLVEQWGLSDELHGRLVQARPGIPVARSLANGDVDLGFQQLSELVGADGVRILGVLPTDCAIDTVFAGAVASAAADAAAAADMLEFLHVATRRGAAAAHSFIAL
ncbi:substrate-binding domain-containing protein [Microbacterium dextranolyticum]|uniref:Molybdenum ABC transporter substrate-binding protein n=1 Tax=Microbacterium dextranolyticum TaxID=36806 RepID=A0A9W6HIY6_9MICO|nr:substrate-binding domain-containing protein [Microbacterium dextranolyticum]MBM7461889.1 molybdate transport system substrate-binding protein [Microbacterium dextranolyticum]GLJ94130.1 hypothetical protein GCM10017591_01910 [Microbacterium dextranolyticum]